MMDYDRQQDFVSWDDNKNALPECVLDAANIRNNDGKVLAWTTADPDQYLGVYAFFQVFGKFLILPCFWPHMVILSPCLCVSFCTKFSQFMCQYWILTEYDLKIVEIEYDYCCCCPGCLTSGQSVQTIPLENITDCGIQAQGSGLCNALGAETPLLYVDTASSQTTHHEALGVGLADTAGMMDAILRQRDYILGRGGGGGYQSTTSSRRLSRMTMELAPPKHYNSTTTTKERLIEVNELKSQDLISKEEFERKREDILNGL